MTMTTAFNFGEVAERKESPEEPTRQIDFSKYGRQVNLFLTGAQKKEFDEMTEALEKEYCTKNATDTVMECLRRATKPIEF